MTKTDWWETFTKTGCVTDYLSYKGIGKEEYSCVQPKNRNVGERTLESVSNSDGDDTVRIISDGDDTDKRKRKDFSVCKRGKKTEQPSSWRDESFFFWRIRFV